MRFPSHWRSGPRTAAHKALGRLQASIAAEAIDGAKWLNQNGNPYARVGNDRTGRTGIDLGVTGAPETFVVDAKGRVRYKHIGPIEPEDWTNTIEPLMRKLRSES